MADLETQVRDALRLDPKGCLFNVKTFLRRVTLQTQASENKNETSQLLTAAWSGTKGYGDFIEDRAARCETVIPVAFDYHTDPTIKVTPEQLFSQLHNNIVKHKPRRVYAHSTGLAVLQCFWEWLVDNDLTADFDCVEEIVGVGGFVLRPDQNQQEKIKEVFGQDLVGRLIGQANEYGRIPVIPELFGGLIMGGDMATFERIQPTLRPESTVPFQMKTKRRAFSGYRGKIIIVCCKDDPSLINGVLAFDAMVWQALGVMGKDGCPCLPANVQVFLFNGPHMALATHGQEFSQFLDDKLKVVAANQPPEPSDAAAAAE